MPNRQLKEYPLYHHYEGSFELSAENSAIDTTYIPFFATDEGLTNPEDVQVNPTNDNYQRQVDWMCYKNSVINNVRLRLCLNITSDVVSTTAEYQALKALVYRYMPVGVTLDDIELDFKDGSQSISSILKLQKESSNLNQIHPTWNGSDLVYPTTLPSAAVGLTTNQNHEAVTFDQDNFEIEIASCELQQHLKRITQGGLRTGIVKLDSPIYDDTWYKVPSYVKRCNHWTFFGLLIHCPQMDATEQFHRASDLAGTGIKVGFDVQFNEYNDAFDQS